MTFFGEHAREEHVDIDQVFRDNEFDMEKAVASLIELCGHDPWPDTDDEEKFPPLHEVHGDLFQCDEAASLAHCISKDIGMGAGIAKTFVRKFRGMREELRNRQTGQDKLEIGDVGIFEDGNRFIYNLITKEFYYDKPTYESVEMSLRSMLSHATEHEVKYICIPKIACGLDGLVWRAISKMIRRLSFEFQVFFTVYIYP